MKTSGDRQREVRAEYASWLYGRLRRAHHLRRFARCLGGCLLKDTHNLALKFRELYGEHNPARMKDEIVSHGNEVNVTAQSLAHASLDSVAVVSLAQHLANGQSNSRTGWASSIVVGCLRRQEPAH